MDALRSGRSPDAPLGCGQSGLCPSALVAKSGSGGVQALVTCGDSWDVEVAVNFKTVSSQELQRGLIRSSEHLHKMCCRRSGRLRIGSRNAVYGCYERLVHEHVVMSLKSKVSLSSYRQCAACVFGGRESSMW